MNPPRVLARLSCAALCGALASNARAGQVSEADTPRTFRGKLDELYLQTDVEMDYQRQEEGDPAVTVKRERILVEPVVGIGGSGSIYHPNLLEFKLNAELGWDWQDASGDTQGFNNESHFLQRYHAVAQFLKQEPYTVSLFADKDLSYRDYDFFNRVRVDSQRYGARGGYSTGPVPFTVTVQHYEETTDDPFRPSSLVEDTLTLYAQNQHRDGRGTAQLNYNLDDYSRKDNGYGTQNGLNQNLNLFDIENFGANDWVRLSSMLNYNSITKTPSPTDKLLIQEALQLQHTPTFRSFYEYAFDHSSAGPSSADTHQGRIGVGHQLFENLSSTFDVHGNTTDSRSDGSFLDTTRYGVTLTEQYNRAISTWGNLALGYQGSVDHEDRDSSGDQLSVIDEAHALTANNVTFLNQPSVNIASVRVTDPTGTILYQEGLDYLLIPHGAVVEIQRVPGGLIPEGGIVLVDYTAQLDPSASFWSFDNHFTFRLDLWKGLVGVYFRWNTLNYSGGENLNLRWLNDRTFGIDSTWRWFRAGAEYETVDSNLSPYDRTRLFESAQFQPAYGTTLSLNFDQIWTDYHDNNITQTTYGFLLRYQQRLTPRLNWNVEGGVRIDRGETFDRDYGTVRTGLDWVMGKLTVRVNYEYNNEQHPTDLRERHYLFIRVRRDLW